MATEAPGTQRRVERIVAVVSLCALCVSVVKILNATRRLRTGKEARIDP
jgi:hypothetical protein